MRTNQISKRIGQAVAGVVLSGSTMFAVGGGCDNSLAGIANVAGATGPVPSRHFAGTEIEGQAAKEAAGLAATGKWVLNHNETLVCDEA